MALARHETLVSPATAECAAQGDNLVVQALDAALGVAQILLGCGDPSALGLPTRHPRPLVASLI